MNIKHFANILDLPNADLIKLERYYKALVIEDNEAIDNLKKDLSSDQDIILRYIIDLFYKTTRYQNYIIINTKYPIPKAYHDIESLTRYWIQKKNQLDNDNTYLRKAIENNNYHYHVIDVFC